MKTIITFFCLLVFSFSTLFAQWKQCKNGPYGGVSPTSFAAKGSTLFVSSNGSVYRSLDSGTTWTATSLTNAKAGLLAATSSAVFAATSNEKDGIFRSTDDGDTWTKVNKGLTGLSVLSFASNGNILFLDGNYEVSDAHRSTDNGDNWIKINLPNTRVHTFAPMGSLTFAIAYYEGLINSLDSGRTWAKSGYISRWNPDRNSVDILVAQSIKVVGTALFVGTNYGVYRSTDSGSTWKSANAGMEKESIAFIEARGNVLFAGIYGKGILRSTDNGVTWGEASNRLIGKEIAGLYVYGSKVFALTYNREGIYSSTNDGETWIASNQGLTSHTITSLLSVGNTMLASTVSNGIYKSSDAGDSWKRTNAEILNIYDMIETNGTILAGAGSDLGIIRSTDFGETWDTVNNGFPGLRSVIGFVKNDTSIFVASNAYGVYRSTDNGNNWLQKNTGFEGNMALKSLKVIDSTLFVARNNNEIYRSTDNGETWGTATKTPSNYVKAIAVANSILFASTTDGIYRSSDSGDTWDITNMPSSGYFPLVSMGNNLFAGTDNGVTYSSNNGLSWKAYNDGLAEVTVRSLLVRGKTLFAGTGGVGIWKIDLSTLDVPDEPNNELSSTSHLSCFPNPATNTLTIDRSKLSNFNNTHPVTYIITTLTGAKLLEYEQNATEFSIPIGGLGRGVYFLTAVQGASRAVVMVTVVE